MRKVCHPTLPYFFAATSHRHHATASFSHSEFGIVKAPNARRRIDLTCGRRVCRFRGQAGVLLLSRNGVTVRPLVAPELTLTTHLASQAGDESKLSSEFVRAYVRKLLPPKKDPQRSLSMLTKLSA